MPTRFSLKRLVILMRAMRKAREAHAFGVKFTQNAIPAGSLAASGHITGANKLL
jgi:hypothetical protein